MADVVSTVLVILVMIFLGYFLKRINLLKTDDIEVLNKLVIYVFMPCLIFSSLYYADLSNITTLAVMPIICLIVGAVSGLIVFIILTLKNYSKKQKWAVIVPVVIGNTAFLGFPMILGIFGQDYLVRAIFYDMGTLTLFLFLSIILMINFGGTIKEVIKKILSFPILWAVILGIIFNISNITIVPIGVDILGYLAAAAIPVIMISLGISLKFKGLLKNIKIASLALIVKLLIAPIIALVSISLMGLSGIESTVGIVEAAMPSGMLSLVLAVNYKLDFNLTADCTIITTIFSLITLPIIMGII
jgi:auxin efflux carrier (AEC)